MRLLLLVLPLPLPLAILGGQLPQLALVLHAVIMEALMIPNKICVFLPQFIIKINQPVAQAQVAAQAQAAQVVAQAQAQAQVAQAQVVALKRLKD